MTHRNNEASERRRCACTKPVLAHLLLVILGSASLAANSGVPRRGENPPTDCAVALWSNAQHSSGAANCRGGEPGRGDPAGRDSGAETKV